MPFVRYTLLASTFAFFAVGCTQTREATRPGPGRAAVPPQRPAPAAGGAAPAPPPSDVRLDGVSILGGWYAVEVLDDPAATRDLEAGTLEMTLLVGPNGRATLTGHDRREGEGPVTFSGRITDNKIAFEGMEGAGTLLLNGRRLILRDPRGRSTAYVRSDD